MTKLINDRFWNKRIETSRVSTLPALHEQMKNSGQWDALRLDWKEGDPNRPHFFWDSDFAKAVESLCYALRHMSEKHPQYQEFQSWIDEAVDMISKAQQPDGYINSYFTVVDPENKLKDIGHKHELYCAGHLLEASIAHYETTGQTQLLDVLCKYMDLICTVFGPGENQLPGYCGHQELELALVKLYEIRPEKRYLDMLNFFIEERGRDRAKFFSDESIRNGIDPIDFFSLEDPEGKWPDRPSYWYMQADKRIRELDEIKGHSVRAMYYLAGAQGLANLIHDQTLTDAVSKLFSNMLDCKFYIHGGIGAIHKWEGFAGNYELPLDCYAETCASIAILFVGQKMLENKLDSTVTKAMERALYNDIIGGASLDGKSFFYNQPVVGTNLKRSSWFNTSCCPPNYARLLNSLEEYVFTQSADGSRVATNFWIGTTFETENIKIKIDTDYPFSGKITIELTSTESLEYAILAPTEKNVKSTPEGIVKNDGYMYFGPRKWKKDVITIEYEMKPRIIEPDPKVESTRGKLAVERGPFVYGIEQSRSTIPLDEIKISLESNFKERIIEIEGTTLPALDLNLGPDKVATFIPYFALGNTHPGEDFRIYLPRDE